MVEELLAARGITVSHETVRQWAQKFDPEIAALIAPPSGRWPWTGSTASTKG